MFNNTQPSQSQSSTQNLECSWRATGPRSLVKAVTTGSTVSKQLSSNNSVASPTGGEGRPIKQKTNNLLLPQTLF